MTEILRDREGNTPLIPTKKNTMLASMAVGLHMTLTTVCEDEEA